MANGLLTAADILLRVGVNADGVDTELASKLSRSERVAVASGDRISASVAANSSKVQAATLRVVAAQERYTTVLQREGATQGQIASSQASLITARRNLARETDRATASTGRLDQKTGALGGTVKGFVAGFAGFAAFGFLRGGIDELSDFQSGLAQSEAGIKSTGGAAKVTKRDIQDLAGSIQDYSGFTDDSVVAGENLLLTFRNVRNEVGKGNDVFDRATRSAADLQARGFGTLETSAKTLGKALNDPVRGLGALSRAGVQFTDEQKAGIKALVEQGDLLGAQKIILRELEAQVGGSAKAFGETLPGGLQRSRRALEDFEQGTVTTIAPVLKALGQVGTFFRDHSTARDAALFAGGTVAALALVNKGVKLYGEVSANVFRRQGEKAAANVVLAGTYDKVAVAADRAAAAEGTESLAGGGGRGLAGRGVGLLGRAGPVGIAAAVTAGLLFADEKSTDRRQTSLADSIATPADLATARSRLKEIERIAQARGGAPELLSEHNDLAVAIAEAAPRVRAAAKKAGAAAGRDYGTAFKASAEAEAFASQSLFSSGQRSANVASARDALNDAISARSAAMSALAEARKSGGGGEAASADDLRIAELRLQAAKASLGGKNGSTASERASVLSAERTLNDLRSKGKATADQTAAAESKVADAIRTQRDAQKRVNEARKALDDARGITAEEALRRIRGDAKAQGTLKRDLIKLTGDNASQETLTALKALEAEAPGTIHRIAEDSGKRFQREFSEALDRINRRTNAIEKLYDGAEDRAARRGRRVAKAFAAAFRDSMAEEDLILGFKQSSFVPAPGGSTPLPAKVRSGGFPTP